MAETRDTAAKAREEFLDRAIEDGRPGLADLLIKSIHDPDPEVRSTAAYGLGEIADARAIPVLIELVDHDPNESVVLHALKSLESYRDDRVRDLLLREADRIRETRSPRWYAAKQLRWYDDNRAVNMLRALIVDQDTLVRQVAHESLIALRPKDREQWDRLLEEDV